MNKRHILVGNILLVGLALMAMLLLVASAMAQLAHQTRPVPQSASTSADSWDISLVPITAGKCMTMAHNLGGDPNTYGMHILFTDLDNDLGHNRRGYGGLERSGNYYGAYWQHLTANTIQVCRMADDNAVDRVSMRLWVRTTPLDYDSGWVNIAQGETLTFNHNVAVTATELTVGLWFSGTSRGIHHYGYGGLTIDAPPTLVGAYWHNLTDNSVQVTRRPNDTDIEQVRVIVTRSDPPTYDSGWQSVSAGSIHTFTHNLNQSPLAQLIRTDCYSPTVGGPGIHHESAGGDYSQFAGWQGINFQNAQQNSIQVARRVNDLACPQVRVRIWTPQTKLYLPLIASNFASTVTLSYDDGSAESWQSNDADSGFAVLFSSSSGQLRQARFYLDSVAGANPVQVHVWDAGHSDMITPFTVTPSAGRGWLSVDLSSYNLTVNGSFYVGFTYPGATYDPSLGVDTSAPDGYSYEVPWEAFANDYMIRAVIVP